MLTKRQELIESLKAKLDDRVSELGLDHPEVLEVSRALDVLIVEEMRGGER